MVYKELLQQVDFDTTSEPPFVAIGESHESVLGRYEQIVGHNDPLLPSVAARAIKDQTKNPKTSVLEFRKRLIDLSRLAQVSEEHIHPDVCMFVLDSYDDRREMKLRFGWRQGLTLQQTATFSTALSYPDTNHISIYQKLVEDIVSTYPTLRSILEKEPKVVVPPNHLLQRYAQAYTPTERKLVESVIRRFQL